MNVVKEKKKIWDLTKPARPRHLEDTHEHFLRKHEASRPVWIPEWDMPRSTAATQLIAALKDLNILSEKLAKKHKEYDEAKLDLEIQWEDLTDKELTLHGLFRKYDLFIKDNVDKRNRIKGKIDDLSIKQNDIEASLMNLKTQEKELQRIKTDLVHQDKINGIYDKFLSKYIGQNMEYKIPMEVLYRYMSLIETRLRLGNRQFHDLDATEKIKNDLFLAFNNQNTRLMTIHNQLIELQKRSEYAKQMADFWEQTIIRIKMMASKRKYVDNFIMKSCWNVYQQICKRKGLPIRLSRSETLGQLNVIQKSYKAIAKTVKMALQEENNQQVK